jgi:pimeloyl-ACP methyl ester carboxylesterase
MKLHKKNRNMFLIVITSLLVLSLLFFAILLFFLSPGKPQPYKSFSAESSAKSISEKMYVTIGGVKQGMFIRSKNTDKPVLLYLHGGPAFPNFFLVEKYNPGLEEFFTVCYWEQRGGGLSFTPEVTLQSMNFDQLTLDAIEVTNYLRNRFGKEKIYLLAHSGGTPIAMMAVAKAPKLYAAYIAVAQITRQIKSEKIAYDFMLKQYSRSGNRGKIKELEKFKVEVSDSNIVAFFKSGIRDQCMHELGIGTMHNMKSVFRDIFIPVWTCKAYTLGEKYNIWKSKLSFLPKTNLVSEMFAFDFVTQVPKVEVPVYFFSGRYDLTVNIDLSKEYFKKIDAPLKGFYTFENSAHSPMFEEPGRMAQIIEQDILTASVSLADKE